MPMTNVEYQRRYREKHPGKVEAYQKSYWERNKARKLWHHAKYRSQLNNLEFDITVEDIVIPDICPILKIPIKGGVGKVRATSPSIDRVDTSKGYTKDNIEVISHKANRLKGDLSVEEVKNLLNYMQRKD